MIVFSWLHKFKGIDDSFSFNLDNFDFLVEFNFDQTRNYLLSQLSSSQFSTLVVDCDVITGDSRLAKSLVPF